LVNHFLEGKRKEKGKGERKEKGKKKRK